ncbi:TetR/AcrR family transcriptional regulator [Geminicoccus roseus]|uniref:TetR/AcrR family transcriptional regulator n=1 Tax=Geminicoccus roseus TaxID=404900 RepID=UPI00040D84DF|nr:TetR/AcrR family transcriptional regulator [Geminicoccus roseus]
MGIAERACLEQTRNESRRQQVLAGATACFCRHGFHSASMAEIAKTAGMSVGHIYHYFENKEAIIVAIVEGNQAEVLAVMDRIEDSPGPLAQALVDTVSTGVDDCMNLTKTALMLEVLAEAARNPKVAAVVQASDAVLRARMREMLCKAAGPDQDPADPRLDERVETLFTLFQGISVRAIRHSSLDRDQTVRMMQAAIRWILQN